MTACSDWISTPLRWTFSAPINLSLLNMPSFSAKKHISFHQSLILHLHIHYIQSRATSATAFTFCNQTVMSRATHQMLLCSLCRELYFVDGLFSLYSSHLCGKHNKSCIQLSIIINYWLLSPNEHELVGTRAQSPCASTSTFRITGRKNKRQYKTMLHKMDLIRELDTKECMRKSVTW